MSGPRAPNHLQALWHTQALRRIALIAAPGRSMLTLVEQMPVKRPQAEVAFIAAAIALIGAPVLMLAGLVAFAVAARVLGPLDPFLKSPLLLPLVFGWAVFVVTVVMIVGVRMSRRMTRP